MYQVTKTYGHERGLSATFRQWKATSHCNKLHGYALAITLIFAADVLDARNWVMDFGALKPVKTKLDEMLDHKTLVAKDDPEYEVFLSLHKMGLIDMVEVDAVGCEAFSALIYAEVANWIEDHYLPALKDAGITAPTNLRIQTVTVAEHGSNSASFHG